jgi:hypothetical protein
MYVTNKTVTSGRSSESEHWTRTLACFFFQVNLQCAADTL